MSYFLTISANFRTGPLLPSIESHCTDIWQLAKTMQALGLPLDKWYPPADTPANSLLNKAFDEAGPATAALAVLKANKENLASDLRSLGVWNGTEEDGAIAYTAMYTTGRIPSYFSLNAKGVDTFLNPNNVVSLAKAIVTLWKPMVVRIAPAEYADKNVFHDRPGVGWMLYLPFTVDAYQVPEAESVINIIDEASNEQLGSLIITVNEVFDAEKPEHIKRANAIETRLVDQDLLPTNQEFVTRF